MPQQIVLVFFTMYFFMQALCAQTLSTKIDALIQHQLPHATVGVLIEEAQTGQVIYSRNADKLLSPASGTKLFTAAAALYQLKPNYTFTTSLAQKNKDLYIRFSGSPSLTSEDLKQLVAQLKNKGIQTIQGNLVIDGSHFKPPYYAAGDSYDDLGWYYVAPSSAIILNENAASIEFIRAKRLGEPAVIEPKTPDDAAVTVINQVITVSKEQGTHCNLNIDIRTNNELRLFGCLVENKSPQVMKLAITDPFLFAKQVIKAALNTNGISLHGQILSGKTPNHAKVLASVQSENLMQLITHMLQESDNLYADSLFKQLGYAVLGEGSYKQGSLAIKQVLSENTDLDLSQIELADGAGTRYNLVTPRQMVLLLANLLHQTDLHFMNALPQAGISGSLKDRMKKTVLEKQVFAKTGTMHDISSLSGYLLLPNHKTLIFSILINGVNTPIATAKILEEKILLMVSEEML